MNAAYCVRAIWKLRRINGEPRGTALNDWETASLIALGVDTSDYANEVIAEATAMILEAQMPIQPSLMEVVERVHAKL